MKLSTWHLHFNQTPCCYDSSPPSLLDPLTNATQALALLYISMTPAILNTKCAPPNILRGWNTAGSFLPASFLQAPLLPLWAIKQALALWLPSFFSVPLCPPLLLMPTWNPHTSHVLVFMGPNSKENMATRSCWEEKNLSKAICQENASETACSVSTECGDGGILAAVWRISK